MTVVKRGPWILASTLRRLEGDSPGLGDEFLRDSAKNFPEAGVPVVLFTGDDEEEATQK